VPITESKTIGMSAFGRRGCAPARIVIRQARRPFQPVQRLEQVDIPVAIGARSQLCAAGDGVVEQALDQPLCELLDRCLLVGVQAP
jgi:hypothetical protein